MHGLILAGGDGSRFAATTSQGVKALMEIGGEAQLLRMTRACQRAGCATVVCAVRQDLASLAREIVRPTGAVVLPVSTPSSLHTLVAGFSALPAGPVLCTLVDSVMRAADWDAATTTAAQLLRSSDAVLAVTSFVHDESPLWVDVAIDGTVLRVGAARTAAKVTGGVYWFADSARKAARAEVAAGTTRLRGFLGALIATEHRVMSVDVPRIVDVDTATDLDLATRLLQGATS
jgi:GTP:adenosylcobinamide-phosphate guanylyltransferase